MVLSPWRRLRGHGSAPHIPWGWPWRPCASRRP